MEVRQLHAPRTGGTALAWALRGTRVKRCGHAKRLVDLDPADRVVTTVRDPVARFASTWGWLRRTGCAVRSPEELLAAPRYIVGPHLDLLRPQSWWLGPPALLHRRALWVGRTEHLDADYARLRAELGLGGDLPPRGHPDRNESEHPPLSAATIAAIRERYAEDYLLLEDIGPMPKSPKVVTVIPSPDLPPTSYVRGVPARGKTMPLAEAQPLLDAKLVIIKPEKPDKKQADETATEKEA